MLLAASEFERAGKAVQNNSQIIAARYNGLSKYCTAQTAVDNGQALTQLHEAFRALMEGWTADPARANEIAPTLPLEMLIISNDLQNYDPKILTRLPALEQSLRASDPTRPFYANLNRDQQQLLIIEQIDAHQFAWTQLPEYQDRETAGNKAIEQFETLRHQIKEPADPRISAQALWDQIESWYLLPTTPPIIDPTEYLAKVSATDDHLALGSQLAAKLRSYLDELSALEDPGEATNFLRKSKEESARGLEELRYFGGVRRLRNSPGYILWTMGDIVAFYSRWFPKTKEERIRLVRDSVEISRKIAEQSPPTGIANQSSNLGFYLYYLATLEENEQKKRTLDEAWKAGLVYEQSTKQFYSHWDWGDAEHFYLYGEIKRETARLSDADKEKVLTESVSMFQKATDTARSVLNSPLALDPGLKQRILAKYLYDLASAQLDLYQETRDPHLNEEALRNLQQSNEFARNQTLPTRAAESLIKLGQAYVHAGKFEKANGTFLDAAKCYEEAATKYPGLASDFHDQAQRLESRASATLAQAAYLKSDYKSAVEHYREASKTLELTNASKALSSFFEAWALTSKAEEQNQTDPELSSKTLAMAVDTFSRAEKWLDASTVNATDQTTSWRSLATLGREYAESRVLLDRAHLLERQGQLAESINQLSKAADQFDKLARAYDDPETRDMMRGHALICRASQAMLEAEQTLRAEHYDQAALLFDEAKKTSKTRSVSSLLGGWAACCRALAIGIHYKDNLAATEFQKMKKYLAIAHSNFTDAGSTSSVSWLAATGRMYDAVAYLAEAESTLIQADRDNLYRQAEEQTHQAIEMFQRAGYTARKDDAERLLQSISEKHTTLTVGPIPAASIAQSTTGIVTPTALNQTIIHQTADRPLLHAALRAPVSPLYPEKPAQLTLTILNPSQTRISLISVENLSQSGLTVRTSETEKTVHAGILNLSGKRLSPLETLQIDLQARPDHPGKYTLQPTIRFVNSFGQQMTHQAQPLVIDVEETGIRAWLRGPRS